LATLHSESEAKNNSEESALAGWTLVWSKDASAPPIPTTPSTVQAAQSVRTPTAIRDSNDPPSEQPAPALLDLEAKQQLRALGKLAAEFSDQRLVLFEQMARLLHAWHTWLCDHQATESHLAAWSDQLRQRGDALAHREGIVDALSTQLHQSLRENEQAEEKLQARQSQLHLSEATLEKERALLLGDVCRQVNEMERDRVQLAAVRRRWAERRRQELQHVRGELERCQQVRGQYMVALEETAA